jgi:flagellar protein FlgJ
MTPEQFVAANLQYAKNAEAETGVPYLVALAQSALESGWGKKAPGNNLFGIRADKAWTGEKVAITTKEFVGGKMQTLTGQLFRAYPTTEGSFKDWGRFLRVNPRYKSAFLVKDDPYAFARAIAAAGYATDPQYAEKLVSMINSVKKRVPR